MNLSQPMCIELRGQWHAVDRQCWNRLCNDNSDGKEEEREREREKEERERENRERELD